MSVPLPNPKGPARIVSNPPIAPGRPITPETRPLGSLQADLERARSEYALRHFDTATAMLTELGDHLKSVEHRPAGADHDRVLLLASVHCLAARLASAQQHEDDAQQLFLHAVRLFELHREEMTRHRSAARMLTDYAIALARSGRLADAIDVLVPVCEQGAGSSEAFGYLGYAHRHLGNLDAAEQAFRTGLQLAPGDAPLTRYLAETLDRQGRYSEAVAAYAEAAIALAETADVATAAALVARALALDPVNTPALAVAFELARRRDDRAYCHTIVDNALSRDATHPWALGLKATLAKEAGDLQTSIDILRAIDVQTPDLGWALVELASALHDQDPAHADEAVALLDRAATLNPQHSAPHVNLARIRLEQQDHAAALHAIRQAIHIEPQAPMVHYEHGRVLFLAGDFESAGAAFDQALTLEPRLLIALAAKGETLRAQGRLEPAVEAFRRVMALDPEALGVVQSMVDALLQLERPDEALDELNASIARNPEAAALHWLKGHVLLRGKKAVGLAVASFQVASSLDPHNGDLLLDLANATKLAGDYTAAASIYTRIAASPSASVAALQAQALYLIEIAAFEEAMGTLQKALDRDPENGWLWGLRGWSLQHIGGPAMEDARHAFAHAAEIDPENAIWHRKGLGNTLCALGREAEARTIFEEIVRQEKYNHDRDQLALLGWCHYRLRRCDEAVRFTIAALENSTEDDRPTLQFDLGLICLAGSRSARGRAEYQTAIKLVSTAHPLRQRGTAYIALFDLVEATAAGTIEPAEAASAFISLSTLLEGLGTDLGSLVWFKDHPFRSLT